MADFTPKTLAILGRQSALGLAELESLYGAERVRSLEGAAFLDIDVFDISFKRLGGTLKLARVLTILPTTNWQEILSYLTEKIPEHMQYQPEGKFTLGISVYNLQVSLGEQTKGLMTVKRAIKAVGKSVRIVPNKTAALNSAQVLHNRLTSKGAWELLLVRDGKRTVLAQSIFVQDIEAYAARDQARPKRDARVGMLPPKLAQIMINLANPSEGSTILDPFCGSGVVLQEALLMGFGALGSDLDKRMVLFSQENIRWLKQKYPNISQVAHIEQGDATSYKWQQSFNAVISEIYLGTPLKSLPNSEQLHKIADESNNILRGFLANISSQIEPETKLSLAVPVWRTKSGFVHLPVLDNLSDLGYNLLDLKHVTHKDLLYFREDQIVARQLIVLEKQ